MCEIAPRAGGGPATLYRHFPGQGGAGTRGLRRADDSLHRRRRRAAGRSGCRLP
ncbi:hypothetical protein [Streptomyces sp. HUAS ZL42]|uniref:hypothetical protein n=1 Tax=Streptomyces sp. HUAS ZL42 TaxID=3231715 RepID=UPI00345EF1DE